MRTIPPFTRSHIQIICSRDEHTTLLKEIRAYTNDNDFSYASGMNKEQILELVNLISIVQKTGKELVFTLNFEALAKMIRLLGDVKMELGGDANPRLEGVFNELQDARLNEEPLKTFLKMYDDISKVYYLVVKSL